jgi:hypothetical protein
MADRIFPNKFQESGLDSELVFTGIDWDNFQSRLAEKKEDKADNPGLEKLLEELGKKPEPNGVSEEELGAMKRKADSDDERIYNEDKKPDPGDADEMDWCPVCEELSLINGECEQCGEGQDTEAYSEMNKTASKIVFDNPNQITAEAVEAAIAEGNTRLANAILAVRHERRVRLASQIETNIKVASENKLRLAQRRAYRESLVRKAETAEKTVRTASTVKKNDGFVAIGELNASGKKAFAAKALAAGFPQEYIEAMINESPAPTENLTEIKEVMASNINLNVKKTVVANMMKVANLDAANINRCKDYWKNELGYGDPEWVDALFENKD